MKFITRINRNQLPIFASSIADAIEQDNQIRLIERSQHADLLYQNKVRVEKNYETYRRRQAIVEHPYGVIKRQWDFYYIMTKKTIQHATADVGLIFTAYNLRRIFNLIDKNVVKQYLKTLSLFFCNNKKLFQGFLSLL